MGKSGLSSVGNNLMGLVGKGIAGIAGLNQDEALLDDSPTPIASS